MYKRSHGFSLPITPSDSYTSNVQPIGSKNYKLETFSWATVPRGWDVFRLLPPPPDNLNRESPINQMEILPIHVVKWIWAVFVVETLNAIGVGILAFKILPNLDAITGAMLTNFACFVPSILLLLSRRPNRLAVLLMAIDALCIIDLNVSLQKFKIILPFCLILISLGWWQNFVHIESALAPIRALARFAVTLNERRSKTYILISIWKCIVYLLMVFLVLTNNLTSKDLFENDPFGEKLQTITARNLNQTQINKFYERMKIEIAKNENGEMSSVNALKFAGMQMMKPSLVLKSYRNRNLINQWNNHNSQFFPDQSQSVQHKSPALSPILSTTIQPFQPQKINKYNNDHSMIPYSTAIDNNFESNESSQNSFREEFEKFTKNRQKRTIDDDDEYEIPPNTYNIYDDYVELNQYTTSFDALWIVLIQAIAVILTYHTSKFACKVMLQRTCFALPVVLSVPATVAVLLDLDFDTEDFSTRNINSGLTYIKPTASSLSSDSASKVIETAMIKEMASSADAVTKIYVCATMWHETALEMTCMLKSIFRLDEDQCARRNAQKYLKIIDPDYYEFEAHIFFDDAFEINEYGEPVINKFVQQLIEKIDEAASALHQTQMKLKAPKKISTPYGGRLSFIMPGKNRLMIHLKDKQKIRVRKRWSQVMYLYYLLGYQLMMKVDDEMRKEIISENTFILTLDGDVDFSPQCVHLLIDLMKKDRRLGAACGRIHPRGTGLMIWYQKFEYAIGHWLQKATEHMIGCVLCSPGCFSLFRSLALMDDNVTRRYASKAENPVDFIQYDQGEDRWLCTLLLQRGYRVEYCAASDALTYAPEGFNEFFNQRRRWIPSTLANIIDLLQDYKNVINLMAAQIIGALFAMLMTAVIVGTVIQMQKDGIMSPHSIFLLFVDGEIAIGCGAACRLMCCLKDKSAETAQIWQLSGKVNEMMDKLDRIELQSTGMPISTRIVHATAPANNSELAKWENNSVKEDQTDIEDDRDITDQSAAAMRNRKWNSKISEVWLNDKCIRGAEKDCLDPDEEIFWNDVCSGFFMVNIVFIIIVLLLQLQKDCIHIEWPLGPRYNHTIIPCNTDIREPIWVFIGMLLHRFGTMAHIIASTQLFCWRKRVDHLTEDELVVQNAVEIARELQAIRGVDEPDENAPSEEQAISRRNIVRNLESSKRSMYRPKTETLDAAFRKRFFALSINKAVDRSNSERRLTLRRNTIRAIERRRNSIFGNQQPNEYKKIQ
uniref:chitin synthase n=1 Tax=Wuchereria bancrofti TaxID=6293 RepID=A0A1I8EVD1_WUCBA